MVPPNAFRWTPQWTTQVRIEGGGRYPLGLNRFHDGLEDILIKALTNAANRLRYVTYCCWAIGDIERNENCTDYAEFVDAFTRRENALALGLYIRKPDYTFYGSNVMSGIVKEHVNTYDCTFRLMQSRDLGAYGLYYAGTIYNWGLTETHENGIIRLTQTGKALYDIIEPYYRQIKPDYYKMYKGRDNVPTEALRQWAEVNDFDNITQPAHQKEREFYQSVLFRLERKQATDYRRDTFAFVMECIEQCSNNGTSFNEDVLRNIHYYSCYIDGRNNVRQFMIPKHLNDVHFYWSVYEGHVYFRWWLSRYFEVFLDYLKSCDKGSTIDEFFAHIASDDFNATITAICGEEGAFFSKPVSTLLGLFSSSPGLSDAVSEESITNDKEHETRSEVLAKFMLVCACLYRKFNQVRSDKRYQYLVAHLGEDLWFEALFRFVDFEKLHVSAFLKTVLKRHIIDQHDLVMMEKNDLRRCWFTTERDRYFYQADVALIWRPAKFQTIVKFLADMKLIDEAGTMVRLSREGDAFLLNLRSGYYGYEEH